MADIRLKDRNGNPVDFYGAEYLDMVTPEGTEVPYAQYDPETLIPENIAEGVVIGDVTGTKADIVTSDLSVDLDFSGGAMEVTPEDGAAFSKVNIPVPENLLAENIAEGVDIAGIVGTLVGGGIAKSGTFFGTGDVVVLEHGLGVKPDFIYLKHQIDIGGSYLICGGSWAVSKELYNSLDASSRWVAAGHLILNGASSQSVSTVRISDDSSGKNAIHSPTAETITIGNDTYKTYKSTTHPYYWLAIGGLT